MNWITTEIWEIHEAAGRVRGNALLSLANLGGDAGRVKRFSEAAARAMARLAEAQGELTNALREFAGAEAVAKWQAELARRERPDPILAAMLADERERGRRRATGD